MQDNYDVLHIKVAAMCPGVLISGTIALAATWLAQHYNTPVMLFALLLGTAFRFLHKEGRCIAGIEFSSKSLLRVGVGLLGARITIADIADLSVGPVLTVAVAVVSTIAFGMMLARCLGLRPLFGLLSGSSVAICGGSAALAVGSSLPEHKDNERDTILTVVVVTALSTVAMIVYPIFVKTIGFDDERAGIFLGGAIHEVAQVIGAGYMISPRAGDVATYVKLLRIAMLLPVVLVIPLLFQPGSSEVSTRKTAFPPFLVGFVLLVALRSTNVVPVAIVDLANDISRWSLVAALAALGMKTSFKRVFSAGWRPVFLICAETAWIAAVVFMAIRFAI